MNEVEISSYRRLRLEEAVSRVSGGDRTAFGRRLGYKDGAFIRQMLNGSRAVSEKTIYKIESLPGMRGWFERAHAELTDDRGRVYSLEDRLYAEIISRYSATSEAARRVVDLVLRKDNDVLPAWATKPLLAAIDTALIVAETSVVEPNDHRPKRVRR